MAMLLCHILTVQTVVNCHCSIIIVCTLLCGYPHPVHNSQLDGHPVESFCIVLAAYYNGSIEADNVSGIYKSTME